LLADLHAALGRRWREDRETAKQHVAELERQSVRDPLTGVAGRSFFTAELERAVSEARRHGQPAGLLFLDADGFKSVNDLHGHLAGDELLRRLAGTLANSVRRSDVLARYGGDEFVVLPSRPSEPGLRTVAERVLATVSATGFVWNGRTVPVEVSVGGALGVPDADDFATRLVDAADQAAYDAKRAGGNRYAFRAL
jgi:diguanylate cyclase (GGDEF)-like protein